MVRVSQHCLGADGKLRGASTFYLCPLPSSLEQYERPQSPDHWLPYRLSWPRFTHPTETRSCCKGVDTSCSLSHLYTPQRKTAETRTPASGNGERVRQDNPLVIWDVEGRSHSAERVWLVSCKAQRNLNNRCLNTLPCKPLVQ